MSFLHSLIFAVIMYAVIFYIMARAIDRFGCPRLAGSARD